MKLTDYIDLLDMSTWSRRTLEKKFIELLKDYNELVDTTINRADSYFFTGIAFLLGIAIALIIFELGGFFQ